MAGTKTEDIKKANQKKFEAEKDFAVKKDAFLKRVREMTERNRALFDKVKKEKRQLTPDEFDAIFKQFQGALDNAKASVKAYDQYISIVNGLVDLWIQFILALHEAGLTIEALKTVLGPLLLPLKILKFGGELSLKAISLTWKLPIAMVGSIVDLDPLKASCNEKIDWLISFGNNLVKFTKDFFSVYPDTNLNFNISVDEKGVLTSDVRLNNKVLSALDSTYSKDHQLKTNFDSAFLKILLLDDRYEYNYDTGVLTRDGKPATNEQLYGDINKSAQLVVKNLKSELGVDSLNFSPSM